jgi:hypothetical protein
MMKVEEIVAEERRLLKKAILKVEHPFASVKLAVAAHTEHRIPKRTRQAPHTKIDTTSNGSE